MAPTPQISEYAIPVDPGASAPSAITMGPDGAVWFIEVGVNRIGRITQTGTIADFSITSFGLGNAITSGPDGKLWATSTDNRIGKIDPSGNVTVISVPTPTPSPSPAPNYVTRFVEGGITVGPDHNVWLPITVKHCIFRLFCIPVDQRMEKIAQGGAMTSFPLNVPAAAIVTGPDGDLWFTEPGSSQIGRITLSGAVSEFGGTASPAQQIAVGPDGNLWFTEVASVIGRLTPTGTVTEFVSPSPAGGIAAGADGNMWFTDPASNKIGRITTKGAISEFPIPTLNSGADFITAGPGGTLWFTENTVGKIGKIVP